MLSLLHQAATLSRVMTAHEPQPVLCDDTGAEKGGSRKAGHVIKKLPLTPTCVCVLLCGGNCDIKQTGDLHYPQGSQDTRRRVVMETDPYRAVRIV